MIVSGIVRLFEAAIKCGMVAIPGFLRVAIAVNYGVECIMVTDTSNLVYNRVGLGKKAAKKMIKFRNGVIALCALFWVWPAHAAPADDLSSLIDDYWASELSEYPFRAEGQGTEPDRLFAGVAPADYERRLASYKAFHDRVLRLERTGLSEEERLNADLLTFILKHNIALAEYRTWRAPFLSDSGFHSNVVRELVSGTFRSEADYDRYLDRLAALPAWLDQHKENMRLGLRDGYAQPAAIMDGVLSSFESLSAGEVKDHPLFKPFVAMHTSLPKKTAKKLAAKGKRVLKNDVIPAYEDLFAFMRDEYTPAARQIVGINTTPNGAALYAALVRYYTTRDDLTPDAIHEIGLREVARIRKEMGEIIEASGFDGSFEEFQVFLRTDPQFYAKTPQELLRRAAWLSKQADGKLPAFFGKLPRQPYSVEPVPEEIAPNYTTGRYSGAPLDADRGGQYWVNTYDLKQRPLYELTALTLHEAVPGHHLQIALSAELENVPAFRQEFYPHAYGEGWGLYAEKLGVEMGMYQTPYDHFGRLSYEMWRAARLVIDTGLHSKGWTRDQAIEYLADNTALSMRNVQVEIDRYIAWPGQALAYKIGELTILELRSEAEVKLGADFSIRRFHDAVLHGGGAPMDILRTRIEAWIAFEQAAAKAQ